MSRVEAPRARTTPQEVRRKEFTARLRGVDPHDVHSFLDLVADDLEGLQAQVAMLTRENQLILADLEVARSDLDGARSDLDAARADPKVQATDQAVSVLNQAQQLADSLIDEAMQSARDLLLTARSQQRDVMEQAQVAAQGAVSRATAVAEQAASDDPSGRDVEYIRMFARVAQVQFQAVLDALNEHVNRLGEMADLDGATQNGSRLQQAN